MASAAKAAKATKAIEAVFRDETGAYLGDLFEQRLALNSRDAKALVAALKKWLVLKVACDDFDATILSPPERIDQAWHLYILDPKRYAKDCIEAFGEIIGHDPNGGANQSARAARVFATKSALDKVYGDRYDKRIWAFPEPAKGKRARAAIVEDEDDAPPRSMPRAKPSAAPGKSLNIRIRDQTGEEIFFKVKMTTQLDKVFNAYAQRKGVATTSFRCLFDGQRVWGDQTPAQIDMDDGDQLDAMLDQQGC